ncbi:Alcohol dehydrogenase, zinc-binding domain protein [mine drainage metagenome]|uniref:Alcohol dehydrogenase, zinc-binding domain protein n=1 Tax=mine drainage metagenome TaxID=410659 RepID=T1A4I1_9ZZZZ
MHAAVLEGPGGPEALSYREVPTPPVGPREVLLRVRAAGVNRLDVWIRNGTYPVPFPHVLGADVAGEVEQVGTEASGRFAPGDRVLVYPGLSCGACAACRQGQESFCESLGLLGRERWGGYAERIVVPEPLLFPLPETMTFQGAAALPVAYTTAEHMLSRAGVRSGERVLLFGATGGVGTALLLRAQRRRARVFAVTGSPTAAGELLAMGAEGVYLRPELTPLAGSSPLPGTVDAVLDSLGKEALAPGLARLRKGGRYAYCGVTSGNVVTLDLRPIYARQISILGCFLGNREDLRVLLEDSLNGGWEPRVHRTFPLSEAAAAHRALEGAHLGKLLLLP